MLKAVKMGSPPRMRGAQCYLKCLFTLIGITPAYAGRTILWSGLGINHRDHPRVCGAHWDSSLESCLIGGSPPRMRGALCPGNVIDDNMGITPAYAGRTWTTTSRAIHRRDHPRVCGAHSSCFCVSFVPLGSPPRMRGAPYPPHAVAVREGITPAYAGRTSRD